MLLCDIPTLYINLEHRKDRDASVQQELAKVGLLNVERFNAIRKERGAIGCSLSHIRCLELAIQRDYDYVLICEDDLVVLNPHLFAENAHKFLNASMEWDVVLIAGNNMVPFNVVTDYCIRIYNCLTTTGYIVRKHYYATLLRNFKEGVVQLMRDPENNQYKIDKHWHLLQKQDRWYMLIPPTIVQREDYSDIEKKVTNFTHYMLHFNKAIRP